MNASTLAALDTRITKLEGELAAAYTKRRGAHIVAGWFYCFDCGKNRTVVALDAESHASARDGRCPDCQEVRRRAHEMAVWFAKNPDKKREHREACPAVCAAERERHAAQDALAEEDLYAPAHGLAAALKRATAAA